MKIIQQLKVNFDQLLEFQIHEGGIHSKTFKVKLFQKATFYNFRNHIYLLTVKKTEPFWPWPIKKDSHQFPIQTIVTLVSTFCYSWQNSNYSKWFELH